MVDSLSKRNAKQGKWQEASSLNRTYQQALIDIQKTIKKPSDETRLAILKAEDIAFEVEKMIGREFRKPPPIVVEQCKHQLQCVHYEKR
ncbi:MAG: hypothetical protein COA63_010730 [Methylophaga sp.]|nr:hypothetical protein [Methylophaga sp.]